MDNDTEVTSNNTCIGASTLANNETINANSSKDYYILVYINNLDEPQYDKGEFVGTVSFVSNQGKRVKGRFNETYNAAEFIKDKFDNDNNKTTVDAADGVQYKYAPTASLMYDRLGGTTTNLEEGNLRYYGANPSNYIDIGDRDAKPWSKFPIFQDMINTSEQCYEIFNCSTNYEAIGQLAGTAFTDAQECEAAMPILLNDIELTSVGELCSEHPVLYQIIGVFNGNLKIIRDKAIGPSIYSWDTSSSNVNNGNGINEWSQADIMKLLNPGYENNQDLDNNGDAIIANNSLWWNSESGNCYVGFNNETMSCDFSAAGLSDEAKNLIVDNLWYLGGIDYDTERESFAKEYYAYERRNNVIQNPSDGIIRTTKWTGKVGLPYPSDYGYATDLSVCTENLYDYDNSCIGNDWLKKTYYWTMTPASTLEENIFLVNHGSIFYWNSSVSDYDVYPVMYLKKDAVIESGTGTKDDPYIAG